MHCWMVALTAAALAAPPAEAGSLESACDARPGVFVGARLHVGLGGTNAGKPGAGLALAPARSRISAGGLIETRIAMGIQLDIAGARTPSATQTGMAEAAAFGQFPARPLPPGRHGISTTAIVIGTALAGALVAAALLFDAYSDADRRSD